MDSDKFADDKEVTYVLYVLKAVLHLALSERALSAGALDKLTAFVEQQQRVFHVAWPFTSLRENLSKSTNDRVAANREFLLALLDAASAQDRDEILTRLKRLRRPER